ncbi:hypothetical protein CERZMDRAFT_90472 [Cercospora zeae-maydis SCOH1-5]|uniref:Uncharacterized protein n=1 Tax=Cercospora zeae-maydis SCOH1-5 TaxID=717836 RepID=A0A6A6FJD2_9PEZI|nr:hypothetical protein CERZMDRAFT_90472 [Cercospora zeae-maydis SCOH1-5]
MAASISVASPRRRTLLREGAERKWFSNITERIRSKCSRHSATMFAGGTSGTQRGQAKEVNWKMRRASW